MTKKKKAVVVDQETGEQLKKPRTWATVPGAEPRPEKNTKPSETQPNQSMSLKQIVDRHRRGLPVTGAKREGKFTYDPKNPDLPPVADMMAMDPIDRAEIIEQVAEHLVEVKAKIAAEAKTAKQKEFLAEVEKAVQEKLAEMNKSSQAQYEASKEAQAKGG